LYEMYQITRKTKKIKVVCNACYQRHHRQVLEYCKECGGKGVHNKSISYWSVTDYKVKIKAIDRDGSGELRYWESMTTYSPESNRRLHFNKKDAQAECIKRNTEEGVPEEFLRGGE